MEFKNLAAFFFNSTKVLQEKYQENGDAMCKDLRPYSCQCLFLGNFNIVLGSEMRLLRGIL